MRRTAVLAALLVLAASAGCALPLPSGIRSAGQVPVTRQSGEPLQVLPPGPRDDATPAETVVGFLGAQASSDNHHAAARAFLSDRERTAWNDTSEVRVYDPDRLQVTWQPRGPADTATVRVTMLVTGGIRSDGSYVVDAGSTVTEEYVLVRTRSRWQLNRVPDGLRLTSADRERAYAPQSLYYLAPTPLGTPPHLAVDQVFLPAQGDLTSTLVARLLKPPSLALSGSVATAVPSGTRLRSPVTLSTSGVATVDLTGMATAPGGVAAQSLSAQLVWTLRSLGPSFRGLRLLADGKALAVPGENEVQDAGEWDTYDPDGLGPRPPYFYVAARRLRASTDLPSGPATTADLSHGQGVAVDQVAVTIDRSRAALLEVRDHDVVVRIGALRGTSFPVVTTGPQLSSPTWGSGDRGLWLVSGDHAIVRVTDTTHPVEVDDMPAGTVTSLAVSRDGVRVAMVVGGQLYVGRIHQLDAGVPTVVGLVAVVPGLHNASQVAWASSTEVVVLGVVARATQAFRVAVDGSSVGVLNTAGLAPTAVAASPAGVVVLSGLVHPQLWLSTGGPFAVQSDPSVGASAPVFPG